MARRKLKKLGAEGRRKRSVERSAEIHARARRIRADIVAQLEALAELVPEDPQEVRSGDYQAHYTVDIEDGPTYRIVPEKIHWALKRARGLVPVPKVRTKNPFTKADYDHWDTGYFPRRGQYGYYPKISEKLK